ncbi:MAG: cytochrome c [Chloroflexi bacterium]|nr:cytochrome c [Chloroflexota bacterium]MBI5711987.1 cytochrome c [Chloroflexota bacterium]
MRKILFLSLIIALLLAACGGSSGPVVGDAARGKKLYGQSTLGKKSAEGCVSCHHYDVPDGKDDKAPYTKGTAARSATRVPGLSAEDYIKESILKPDAYVVDKYKAGDMYQKWGEDLSAQELADLVAYLLTEK